MSTGRRIADWTARAPLVAGLAFLALFVLLPLGLLAAQTVFSADGFTLDAWRHLFDDEHLGARLLASLGLGLAATLLSLLLGGGYAWICLFRDLPGAGWLTPMGVAPLVVPPIFIAMGFADLLPVSGFWPCALLLGIAHAPFVAVLAARGLRSVDGRAYESAWLLRGRGRAELWLLRAIAPELVAGCLLAFLFTVADHGVPEFLTVKGKTWHTYAEGILTRWQRRAVGTTFADLQSPIVAALPFVGVLATMLWLALRLRGASGRGITVPLPVRPLGRWRWPALFVPSLYLLLGVALPVLVLARWALGSAQRAEPMSLAFAQQSFRKAVDEGVPDLVHSLWLAAATAVAVAILALPLARASARGSGRRWPWLQLVAALPVAAPAILLGMGLVRACLDGALTTLFGQSFYDGWGLALAGYAARFLPFAVLTLAAQVQRLPRAAEDAAMLSPRSRLQRAWRVHLPPLLPSLWAASVLVFVLALRELDLAVMLPAANATAVRRLANSVHYQHEDWSGMIGLMLLLAAVLVPLLPSLLAGKRLSSLS